MVPTASRRCSADLPVLARKPEAMATALMAPDQRMAKEAAAMRPVRREVATVQVLRTASASAKTGR